MRYVKKLWPYGESVCVHLGRGNENMVLFCDSHLYVRVQKPKPMTALKYQHESDRTEPFRGIIDIVLSAL